MALLCHLTPVGFSVGTRTTAWAHFVWSRGRAVTWRLGSLPPAVSSLRERDIFSGFGSVARGGVHKRGGGRTSCLRLGAKGSGLLGNNPAVHTQLKLGTRRNMEWRSWGRGQGSWQTWEEPRQWQELQAPAQEATDIPARGTVATQFLAAAEEELLEHVHATLEGGDPQQVALARHRLHTIQEAQEEQEARLECRRWAERNWREAEVALTVATNLVREAQNRRIMAEERLTEAEEQLARAHAAERETRVLGPRRKRRRVVAVPAEAPVEQALAERAPSEVAVAEQSRADCEPESEDSNWS